MRGLVVGLTGGIACGKSTVARFLKERGARIISADELAHRLLKRGSPVYQTIIATFGERIIGDDGDISRSRLGSLIFQDETARRKLNEITHPVIIRQSLMEAYQYVSGAAESESVQEETRIAVLDAPLLFEAGMQDMVDIVVVVFATEATQITRMLERAKKQGRTIHPEEARRRIAAQLPVAEKARHADIVIENEYLSLSALKKEVDALWEKLQNTHTRKKALDDFENDVV